MEIPGNTLDNYRNNLWRLREATDKLSSRIKGHNFSFRSAIADTNGDFAEEKLRTLVGELLSGWADYVRDGLYPDRSGEENPAESYLLARREMYSLYLYLTMRCSLCEGAYALANGREGKRERADCAFVLEQAKRFAQSWCIMASPDGARWNEPYEGFDAYFGFHLYHILTGSESQNPDSVLTPWEDMPMQNLSALTNAGSMKRIYCMRLSPPPRTEEPAEMSAAESMADDEDYGGDYNPEEEGWEQAAPFDDIFAADELERLSAEDDRASGLSSLALRFEGQEKYVSACRRFAALYREAPPEVLRGFYAELEEVVNLYLLRRGLTILADTGKTLDLCSRIYDGPGRQARLYERGILWGSLP